MWNTAARDEVQICTDTDMYVCTGMYVVQPRNVQWLCWLKYGVVVVINMFSGAPHLL